MNPDHSARASLSAALLVAIALALAACGSSAGSDGAGPDSSTAPKNVTTTTTAGDTTEPAGHTTSSTQAGHGSDTTTKGSQQSTGDALVDGIDTSGTLCQALKGYNTAMGTILAKSGGMATGNAEATASLKAVEAKVATVVAADLKADFHTAMAYYYENETAEKTPAQVQAETNLSAWLKANCKVSDLGG